MRGAICRPKPIKDHHQRRRRCLPSSLITIMNGLPTSLPERIRSMLPDTFNLALVPRIPVTTHPSWHHLVFDSTRMKDRPHNSGGERTDEQHVDTETLFSCVPRRGELCWLVFPNPQQHFLGRVGRVAEYQETQVVLRIEHVRSPGILALAVPYQFWTGKGRTGVWRLHFRFWRTQPRRKPDSGEALPGKPPCKTHSMSKPLNIPPGVALDPTSCLWEIDDNVQELYDPA